MGMYGRSVNLHFCHVLRRNCTLCNLLDLRRSRAN